jgi:outer membrane immunogenic protein
VKKFLLSVTALVAIGSSAMAADLAVRRAPAPAYAPVPVRVFTWTGCYVGGNVGGIWAHTEWNDSVFGNFGSGTASGAIGGVQGGCNYQMGSLVLGIQGDYDWTNAKNDTSNVVLTNLFGGPLITNHSQIDSLASVTGRVGYAFDRFLGYVKGGGAWMRDSLSFQAGGLAVVTASSTRGGWTIGVGGEYAFNNWLTGFVEYDYYKFDNDSPSALVCTPGRCGVFFTNAVSVNTEINVVKAGLNVKFGPGGVLY